MEDSFESLNKLLNDYHVKLLELRNLEQSLAAQRDQLEQNLSESSMATSMQSIADFVHKLESRTMEFEAQYGIDRQISHASDLIKKAI